MTNWDQHIDDLNTVKCGGGLSSRGGCGDVVPSGTAHIVVSPNGPSWHVMYCPGCCPCTKKEPPC